MVTPELIAYVHEQLEAGYSIDAIRQVLLDAGWSKKAVQAALIAPPPPSKHQQNLSYLALVFIVLALGVGTFVTWRLGYYHKSRPAQVAAAGVDKQVGSTLQVAGQQASSAPVPHCDPYASADTYDISSCVQTNFTACTPAEWTASIDLGKLGGVVEYHYQILGVSRDGCMMQTKYLKNPNPGWIDKDMTCAYDNKKEFDDAVASVDRKTCQGPLEPLIFSR